MNMSLNSSKLPQISVAMRLDYVFNIKILVLSSRGSECNWEGVSSSIDANFTVYYFLGHPMEDKCW